MPAVLEELLLLNTVPLNSPELLAHLDIKARELLSSLCSEPSLLQDELLELLQLGRRLTYPSLEELLVQTSLGLLPHVVNEVQ